MIIHDLNALHPMRVDLTRDTYTDGMERIIARVMEILGAADDTVEVRIEHIPKGEESRG